MNHGFVLHDGLDNIRRSYVSISSVIVRDDPRYTQERATGDLPPAAGEEIHSDRLARTAPSLGTRSNQDSARVPSYMVQTTSSRRKAVQTGEQEAVQQPKALSSHSRFDKSSVSPVPRRPPSASGTSPAPRGGNAPISSRNVRTPTAVAGSRARQGDRNAEKSLVEVEQLVAGITLLDERRCYDEGTDRQDLNDGDIEVSTASSQLSSLSPSDKTAAVKSSNVKVQGRLNATESHHIAVVTSGNRVSPANIGLDTSPVSYEWFTTQEDQHRSIIEAEEDLHWFRICEDLFDAQLPSSIIRSGVAPPVTLQPPQTERTVDSSDCGRDREPLTQPPSSEEGAQVVHGLVGVPPESSDPMRFHSLGDLPPSVCQYLLALQYQTVALTTAVEKMAVSQSDLQTALQSAQNEIERLHRLQPPQPRLDNAGTCCATHGPKLNANMSPADIPVHPAFLPGPSEPKAGEGVQSRQTVDEALDVEGAGNIAKSLYHLLVYPLQCCGPRSVVGKKEDKAASAQPHSGSTDMSSPAPSD